MAKPLIEQANRMLAERPAPQDGAPRGGRPRRPARSVTVNLAESPLGWLKARGLVDARQYEAGERLRGDWTIAGLGPRVTMRWDAGARSTGDGLDPALAQIAAKRRMEAALDAVGRMCCGASSARARAWKRPSARSAGRRAPGGWC